MQINNQTVIKLADNFGFELIGFTEAKQLDSEIDRLTDWLNKGFHAGMDYMARNLDKRKDVRKILSTAKSVISLGMNYYTPAKHSNDGAKGKVSRYAWGKDYHLVIWEKLNKIIEELKANEPAFEAISYVDTGPVMDKAWAVRSGLGWQGKHTNIINKDIGSWFFIANIITNWEFDYSFSVQDFCGTCTACIDACPTNAIVKEYVVDSNKCISYLTIENKAQISKEFRGKFENWIFGCDICQDVCPWNVKFANKTSVDEFNPKDGNDEIELDAVINFNKNDFKQMFDESPIKRAKLGGLKRNADFLLNSKS